MGLNYKNQVALFKEETTKGTDAVPTNLLNAIRIAAFEMTPLAAEDVEIPEIRAALGAKRTIPGQIWGEFTITINLFANGPAGTALPYGPLLLSAAHAQVITASTRVDYNPISSAFKTFTLYHYIGGIRHRTLAAVGSAKFTFAEGQIPQLVITGQGTSEPIIDAAVPVPTLTTWTDPKPVNYENTTATVGGYAACISNFELDSGLTIERFNRINCKSTEITDRNASGTITMEMTTVAAKDWYAIAKAGTPQVFQLNHNVLGGAGEKLRLSAPEMIIKPFTYQEDRGITMIQASLVFPPTAAGNDEYQFTAL